MHSDKDGNKALHVTIPNDLHVALKVEAAERGLKLKHLIESILKGYINAEK